MFTFFDQPKIDAYTWGNKKIIQKINNDHNANYTDCKNPKRQIKNPSKQKPSQNHNNAYYDAQQFRHLHRQAISDLWHYWVIGVTGIILSYILFCFEPTSRSVLDFFAYLLAPGILQKLISSPNSSRDMALTLLSWISTACITAGIWKIVSLFLTTNRGETLALLLAFIVWVLPIILLWAFWQFSPLFKLVWTFSYIATLWIVIVWSEL